MMRVGRERRIVGEGGMRGTRGDKRGKKRRSST